MKNAQNEFGTSAEKSLSATTTTITTTTETAIEEQSAPLPPAIAAAATTVAPIKFSTDSAENVQNNNATAANAAAAASATTSHAAKMTNEQTHENKNDKNSSNSVNNKNNINNNNNNNESGSSLIAEAAKILLKNGLNGTSAAAAALLASQSFQLPTFSLVSIPKSSPETSLEPPPAHVASTSKMSAATVSSALALGNSPHRNNGLPSPSHFKSNAKDTYSATGGVTTTASSSGFNLGRKSLITLDAGVIDCSLGTTANGTQKATGIGGAGYSQAGGRLQFFKDGKFILELARSKDGERGGWVSVPRKQFRTPSATSSTVTPASTANACIYPKMESSTSFSFSDDNSSIQSSPWQRDHCWKQLTPKRNISKEMSVFYQLPNGVKLTNDGLRLAKLKRRRPFDNTKIDIKHVRIFEKCSSNESGQLDAQVMPNGKSNSKFATAAVSDVEEEDRGSSSSLATLIGENDNERTEKIESHDQRRTTPTNLVDTTMELSVDDTKENTEKTKTLTQTVASAAKAAHSEEKMESDSKMDETTCNSDVEKMNTSDEGETSTETECKISANVTTNDNDKTTTVASSQSDQQKQQRKQQQQRPLTPKPVKSKTGVEDKRLIKKRIERAKLTTIVQKLIDQMPSRVTNVMKTPLSLNNSAGTQQQSHSNFLSNKIPPTSSSSTSPSLNSSSTTSGCSAAVGAASHRLVEYHQQHVSPRKRILREFEKVSLDDNTATATGAGGKRSRAKSSANAAINASYRNARSPNNRVQSSVCSVPTVASLSSSITTSSTTNGESVTKSNKSATTAAAPTRVYSSYSIHSLLGDNASSKKTSDHSAANAFQQPQSDHLFHMGKSVSPKSPETVGGKSPSNSAHKKRSPPYASPLREAHSRSPTVIGNNVECSPRATPPIFKQRYDAPGLLDHPHNLTSVHSLHHQHQQQHHHHQQRQGAFYSPYMMSSSKYVPGASGAPLSTAGAVSPPSTSRSPRHSINAFTSCTTTATTATATMNPTHYIPNAHRTMPHRETSPPPRSPADSPRDSTPRTVPKKTASIRRQFASPTSSSSSQHSQNNASNSSGSCPSPGERAIAVSGEDSNPMDSKSSSAAAAAAAAAYQQLFQRQSASAAAASTSLSSPIHPAAYYMYPPSAPLPFSSNGASGASASAHPTSTSPYIPSLMPPSYYHSYISALNITKHYYMGAGASPQSAAAAAAARLSPPFHHLGIPYNGIAMAAAAAAAFTGQPQSHLSHHSMLPPAAATAAALYGVSSLGSLSSLTSSAPATITTATHKTSESSLGAFNEPSLLSNISSSVVNSAAATSMRSTAVTAQHSHNIKDEQSSDVPLNLSKH